MVLLDGRKFIGELRKVGPEGITLSYPAASSDTAADKKKVKGVVEGEFRFDEIKKASEHITFQ
jgi:hypothetical protein